MLERGGGGTQCYTGDDVENTPQYNASKVKGGPPTITRVKLSHENGGRSPTGKQEQAEEIEVTSLFPSAVPLPSLPEASHGAHLQIAVDP